MRIKEQDPSKRDVLFAYRARSNYQLRRAVSFNVMGCQRQAVAAGTDFRAIAVQCDSIGMLTPVSFDYGSERRGPAAYRNASQKGHAKVRNGESS